MWVRAPATLPSFPATRRRSWHSSLTGKPPPPALFHFFIRRHIFCHSAGRKGEGRYLNEVPKICKKKFIVSLSQVLSSTFERMYILPSSSQCGRHMSMTPRASETKATRAERTRSAPLLTLSRTCREGWKEKERSLLALLHSGENVEMSI